MIPQSRLHHCCQEWMHLALIDLWPCGPLLKKKSLVPFVVVCHICRVWTCSIQQVCLHMCVIFRRGTAYWIVGTEEMERALQTHEVIVTWYSTSCGTARIVNNPDRAISAERGTAEGLSARCRSPSSLHTIWDWDWGCCLTLFLPIILLFLFVLSFMCVSF